MVRVAGVVLAFDFGAEGDVDRWVDTLPQAFKLLASRRSCPLAWVAFAFVGKGCFG